MGFLQSYHFWCLVAHSTIRGAVTKYDKHSTFPPSGKKSPCQDTRSLTQQSAALFKQTSHWEQKLLCGPSVVSRSYQAEMSRCLWDSCTSPLSPCQPQTRSQEFQQSIAGKCLYNLKLKLGLNCFDHYYRLFLLCHNSVLCKFSFKMIHLMYSKVRKIITTIIITILPKQLTFIECLVCAMNWVKCPTTFIILTIAIMTQTVLSVQIGKCWLKKLSSLPCIIHY